jgi:hypothetical protein
VRPKKIGAKRNGDDRSRPGRVLILKRAGAGNEAVASFTEIFAAIGAFILGSGAISAIAFGLFKVLGEKWLNAKFRSVSRSISTRSRRKSSSYVSELMP